MSLTIENYKNVLLYAVNARYGARIDKYNITMSMNVSHYLEIHECIAFDIYVNLKNTERCVKEIRIPIQDIKKTRIFFNKEVNEFIKKLNAYHKQYKNDNDNFQIYLDDLI